jgi:tetratricopeptide (TPR) repeat protein
VPVGATLLVLAAVAATYADVFTGTWGWLLDDTENYVDNKHIHDYDIEWCWFDGVVLDVYEPIALTFKTMLVYPSFGLNPDKYRQVSLAIHCVNVVGIMAVSHTLLARIFLLGEKGDPRRKIMENALTLGTFFYGCHPLRAQVVGWASCIPYLLSGPFALLAVYAYIEADCCWSTASGKAMMLVAGFGFACSVLCKAPGITLPGVMVLLSLLLTICAKKPRNPKQEDVLGFYIKFLKTWALKFWWLPLLFGFLFNLVLWGNSKIKRVNIEYMPPFERVMRAGRAIGFYLSKLILPLNLKAGYFIPTGGVYGVTMECYAGMAVVLVLTMLSVFALLSRSVLRIKLENNKQATASEDDPSSTDAASHPASPSKTNVSISPGGSVSKADEADSGTVTSTLCLGAAITWLCYVILLLPTLGLVQHGSPIMAADRYTYLADMVFVPAFAALCTVLGIDLHPLAASTGGGGAGWADKNKSKGKGKQGAGMSTAPRALGGMVVLVLAVFAMSSRDVLSRYRGSLPLWKHAVDADDTDGEARLMYGEALVKMPQPPMDKSNFKEAIDVLEAVLDRNMSINTRPKHQLHFYVGSAYKQGLNFEKTVEHYKASVNINPRFDPAQYNLGNVLMYDLKRYDEAAHHYAMSIKPGSRDHEAHLQAAGAFEKTIESDKKSHDPRHHECTYHYKQAVEMQPFDPGLRQRFGVYYSRNNRHQRAIVEYKKCNELTRGRHLACWKNMAMGLQAVHQPEKALEAYEKALKLGDKNENTPQRIQEIKTLLQQTK